MSKFENLLFVMKRLFSLLMLSLFLLSCQDETLDNMNAINGEWETKNAEITAAKAKMEAIMSKYAATSFEVAISKKDNQAQDKELKFYDRNHQGIESIDKKDVIAFYEAYSKTKNTEVEMSQLADGDEVFSVVEIPPKPVGGMQSLYAYLGNGIKYPKAAKDNGIEGKVFVQFVVTEFGEITDVKVIKGIGSGCDEEAARVVKAMDQWEPGKQRGEAVKVKMVLPISFKIS